MILSISQKRVSGERVNVKSITSTTRERDVKWVEHAITSLRRMMEHAEPRGGDDAERLRVLDFIILDDTTAKLGLVELAQKRRMNILKALGLG